MARKNAIKNKSQYGKCTQAKEIIDFIRGVSQEGKRAENEVRKERNMEQIRKRSKDRKRREAEERKKRWNHINDILSY